MTVRTFVALPIDDTMASVLGDIAAQMSYQDKGNAVRWVVDRNYHLTLAFLGELEYEQVDRLADNLASVLEEKAIGQELLLEVSHLSPFPESKPKHIAAMIKKTDDLTNLQEQVAKAVRMTGLEPDKRRFFPHITLGRYRHYKGRSTGVIPQGIEAHALVDSVVIFESILTPEGAIYEPQHELAIHDGMEVHDDPGLTTSN